MDREPAAMAHDIVRRWMPGYLATIGKALENARQAEQERAARRVMNRRMEQVLPGLHAAHLSEHETPHRTTSYLSGVDYSRTNAPRARASGSVQLSGDAREAKMVLTGVPAEVVLKILALLNASQALEGTIGPRRIAPVVGELPAQPSRIIPGELHAPDLDTGPEPLAIPGASCRLF